MLININNLTKSFWHKPLYEGLDLAINNREKSALIGRNGTGKTSLFRIITGLDKEYTGTVEKAQGTKIIMTQQEHYLPVKISGLEYILDEVPHYKKLREIVFHNTQNRQKVTSEKYLESIQDFTERDYYHLEDNVIQTLEDFQITAERALEDMAQLSGGEKRFIELVRIMYSGADLALVDEPTNHMDYTGKEKFINWLKYTDQACIIITHDRDVLNTVDSIFELNELKLKKYNGNYEKYLKQNSLDNVGAIHKFETGTKHADKLKARVKEIDSIGTVTKRMKIMRERMKRQLADVEKDLDKPSFWIDQNTLENTSKKVVDKYEKYKDTNITMAKATKVTSHHKLLVQIRNLELGYTHSLFNALNMDIYETDRIRLVGRNGAGKTTFIKYLIKTISALKYNIETNSLNGPQKNKAMRLPQIVYEEKEFEESQKLDNADQDEKPLNYNLQIKHFSGELKITNAIKLGIYEQEISPEYLEMTLSKAIMKAYSQQNKILSPGQLIATLENYLFNKDSHFDTPLNQLSGGEKARFQLIKMLIGEPNLLIMDEPTNHLDLPSIEVLENFIRTYTGGILYVSHDSFFVNSVGGKEFHFIKNS